MATMEPAQVKEVAASATDHTHVEFSPDLKRLGIDGEVIPPDDVALMLRRAVDIAGTAAPVKVIVNGDAVPINSFHEYIRAFDPNLSGDPSKSSVFLSRTPDLEIGCCVSCENAREFNFLACIHATDFPFLFAGAFYWFL